MRLAFFFIRKLRGSIWLSRSVMACWCTSFIWFASCCRICGNIRLQQCLLKFFASGCWLENTSSYTPFFVDVNIVFLRIFWPIHWFCFWNEPYQLTLLGVIFLATKVLYNISGINGIAIFQCPEHFPGADPRYFIVQSTKYRQVQTRQVSK